MYVERCDDCCNVLNETDGGVVYECDEEVYDKYGFEHLCDDCISSNDEIYLYENDPVYLVKIV